MEENICILMADLSGYTALTEVHGAASAADLIDTYLALVEECLVGDCKLQERVGDEVMIVSTTPDFLLATAIQIMNSTANLHNFLQVHGGLHFGKVLKRRDSYFGAAINLTSRIAANASPGTFWCSEAFVQSLSSPPHPALSSIGKHSFKNISGSIELYELGSEHKGAFFIDSVCKMLILDKDNAIKHPTEEDTYFCTPSCYDIYIREQLKELGGVNESDA